METIKDIINYLIIICDSAGALRLLYCLLRIMGSPDEAKAYEKKMINLTIFLIIANSLYGVTTIIKGYF